MKKKGSENTNFIVGLLVVIVLACALIPAMKIMIASGSDKYICNDAVYNSLYNSSLCLNTTSYLNETATGYINASYVGLSGVEIMLMSVSMLIIIIGIVMVAIKKFKK